VAFTGMRQVPIEDMISTGDSLTVPYPADNVSLVLPEPDLASSPFLKGSV